MSAETLRAWRSDIMPVLIERMNDVIINSPEMLLETDGGPVGARADVVLARLLGPDDQVMDDMWLTDRAVPAVWRSPIMPKLTLAEPDPVDIPSVREAEYVLQSGYVEMWIAQPELLPPGVVVRPPDFRARVLYVRYRRRL